MARDKYIVIYVEDGLTRWHDSSFYMETLQFAERLAKCKNVSRVSLIKANSDFCNGVLLKKFY